MDAYVLGGVYTPRGRAPKGALGELAPAHLGAYALRGMCERLALDPKLVCDVIMGVVTQTREQGANLAKTSVMLADWPDSISGATVNRHCASGLSALVWAAQKVATGSAEVVVAAGVESMSRVPILSDKGPWFADPEISEKTGFLPMGVAADLLATREEFSREQLDALAVESQRRAKEAPCGASLIPVETEVATLAREECPRWVTAEKLASLAAPFGAYMTPKMEALIQSRYQTRPVALHTVATSPALADAASAIAIVDRATGEAHGKMARARIAAVAEIAVDPVQMLEGNVAAVHSALKRAGWSTTDVDLFEVNESFAAVPLHFMKKLRVPANKLNVNGGAIALGHPLGATGGILLLSLLDALDQRDLSRGIVSICGGAGVATAIAVERL